MEVIFMLKAEELKLVSEWDKTFPKSEKVDHEKVTFVNRYGITLAAPGLPAASSVGTPTGSTSVFSSKSSSSFILYFFSAILNLALRLRGFARCSSSPGTITLLWTALSGQSTLP